MSQALTFQVHLVLVHRDLSQLKCFLKNYHNYNNNNRVGNMVAGSRPAEYVRNICVCIYIKKRREKIIEKMRKKKKNNDS
jgi:hypothetical protein